MTSCTLSTWFKVPVGNVDAIGGRDSDVNPHVVPILMWGAQKTISVPEFGNSTETCIYEDCCPPITIVRTANDNFFITGTRQAPIQPSCIGVDVKNKTLFVHIQPNNGTVNSDGVNFTLGPEFHCGEGGGTLFPVWTPHDISSLLNSINGGAVGNSAFGFDNTLGAGPFGGAPKVKLGVWQHLFMSWRLGNEFSAASTLDQFFANSPNSERISTTSKLYCAVNDVNLNGFDLPATWVGVDGRGHPDKNLITCGQVAQTAFGVSRVDIGQPLHTCTMSYGKIPASPLLVPGFPTLRSNSGLIVGNQHIMQAEMQIFPGVRPVDTSDEKIRRLVLTAKGKPELDYSKIDRLLGKPAVRLHKTGNWKKGKNIGGGGQFTPTGKILKYKPDPSLHGDQGKP